MGPLWKMTSSSSNKWLQNFLAWNSYFFYAHDFVNQEFTYGISDLTCLCWMMSWSLIWRVQTARDGWDGYSGTMVLSPTISWAWNPWDGFCTLVFGASTIKAGIYEAGQRFSFWAFLLVSGQLDFLHSSCLSQSKHFERGRTGTLSLWRSGPAPWHSITFPYSVDQLYYTVYSDLWGGRVAGHNYHRE